MTELIVGIALWSLVHLVPALLPGVKARLVKRLGANGYKGLFALLVALSVYLIVSGWKAALPLNVYAPPDWGRHVTPLFVLLGFILFFAPYLPNNLKRLLRHPQLTGVALWGVGHLFANGEGRSIVLFAGMAAWAVVEMLAINRRDGARSRPPAVSAWRDLVLAALGIAAFVAIAAAHRWLFGFSPFNF